MKIKTVIPRIFFVLLFLSVVVSGHHFKGLPHFSYFENYPQIPQDEFLAQNGEYEYSLVLYDFQGIDKRNVEQPDDVRFYLVIYHMLKGKAYKGSVTLNLYDGKKLLRSIKRDSSEEESLYSFSEVLPKSGRFWLEVQQHDGIQVKTKIPFKLSSQKYHWGKWILIVLALLVLVVGVGSRKARINKDKKMDMNRARAPH